MAECQHKSLKRVEKRRYSDRMRYVRASCRSRRESGPAWAIRGGLQPSPPPIAKRPPFTLERKLYPIGTKAVQTALKPPPTWLRCLRIRERLHLLVTAPPAMDWRKPPRQEERPGTGML